MHMVHFTGGCLGPRRELAQPIIGNILAQGLVGGLNSVIQGGNFGSGFLAAGVASLAGPIVGSSATITPQGLIVSAVLGGAASVLGGGKFANGAITGAFAYAVSIWASESSVSRGNSSTSQGSATEDECHYSVDCLFGSSHGLQGTQLASNDLQAQCSAGSLGACTAAVDAQGHDPMAEALRNYVILPAAAGAVAAVGVTGATYLGAVRTIRIILEFGNAFSPETDLIPEIEAIRPPAPPPIIEPVSPPEPPPLPKKP